MQVQELRHAATPAARAGAGSTAAAPASAITTTPDRRYMIVKGRLWRLSDPRLDAAEHAHWVGELMKARRAIKVADATAERLAARIRVDAAKRALGERGSVWWTDGAPDYNRRLVEHTPYRAWYETHSGSSSQPSC